MGGALTRNANWSAEETARLLAAVETGGLAAAYAAFPGHSHKAVRSRLYMVREKTLVRSHPCGVEECTYVGPSDFAVATHKSREHQIRGVARRGASRDCLMLTAEEQRRLGKMRRCFIRGGNIDSAGAWKLLLAALARAA